MKLKKECIDDLRNLINGLELVNSKLPNNNDPVYNCYKELKNCFKDIKEQIKFLKRQAKYSHCYLDDLCLMP